MNKRFLILILTLLITPITFGQNPFITNYTIADGLPSNKIFCVLQDKNGFMWFGTNEGVIRFDGSNYEHYTSKDGLSYNSIVRMKEDMEGRIWCLNTDGSVNYIFNNHVFNESNTPFLGEIKTNFFYHDFFQNKDSTIYMYNGAGEVTVIKGNQYIDYTSSSPNGSVIFNISRNSNNNLLFWESNRIVEKNTLDEIYEIHPLDFNINKAVTIPEGLTYVSDINGNVHLFKDTRMVAKNYLQTHAKNVNDIFVDNDLIWISTFDKGLFCFKDDSLIFHHNIEMIQNLILDKHNNIWTSSMDYGVFKINSDILKYHTISSEEFNGKGVKTIAPSDNGFFWLTNGASLFTLKNEKVYDAKLSLGGNVLQSIHHLTNNTLLINGVGTPLYIIKKPQIDETNHTVKYSEIDKTALHIRKSIVGSSDSTIIYYLNDDVFFLKPERNYIQQHVNYKAWGRIFNLFLNYKQDLVVNGNINLVISEEKIIVDSVYSKFDGKRIVSNATINSSSEILQIEEKENSRLILIKNNRQYSLLDNLMNHVDLKVRGMIHASNTLFLYTPKTVYFISNPSEIVDGKTPEFNRLNIEFNNIYYLLVHDDILYIASDNGLTFIPVSECVNTLQTPTRPYFSKVSLDNKEVDFTNGIVSYKNKDRLNIEFSSLNFSSSPTNYAYMLEGVNNDWITGTANQVVYLNLKPGNYTFKLKSRKNMEPYSEVIALPIVVVPTFFQLLITRIAAVLILLSLGFLVIRNYYRRQLLVREKDNQLVTLENRALQSMMNPHFIFNSLGSIQKFLLQNKAEEAGTYLSQFARLIRQTMNSIKSNSVLLEDEVERLRNYIELEKVRMENRFEFSIIIDEELEDDYNIPSMIIQPFVENAIWHGISQLQNEGKITIRFNYINEKSVEVVIEDNGIGFEKSKAFSKTKSHLNMASTLTQKRIQLIGEKYHVKTKIEYADLYPGEPNPGAKITILLPIVD